MTALPTTKPQHSISIDAGPAPWEARRLDTIEQMIREFVESAAAEKSAIARHAQNKARIIDAWIAGDLDGYRDMLDENLYQFPGIDFVVKDGVKSYPINAYSESTQALIKEERLNGAFRIGEKTLRPKFHD